jgi:integrase
MNKNKHKKRSWRLVQRIDGIGLSRQYCKEHGLISSLNTKQNYHYCLVGYLYWREVNDLPSSQQDRKEDLENFLNEICEIYMQKTVDAYRSALSLVFKKKLPNIKSEIPSNSVSRNYHKSEILLLITDLTARNAFSILLCFYSGLRAHELLTLRKVGELKKSNKRTWSDERFAGLERYQIYTVKGKGGLIREVAIPNELAIVLENSRLTTQKVVIDRGIRYGSYYDVAAGKALSEAFSRASKKVLNWSTGLHGTRHSYAQSRLFQLLKFGIEYEHALKIVSEELGHFRPSITLCYLR